MRLGRFGEAEARHELESRGYRIVAGNYACRNGEADLVAWDADTLVFVEVKTRSSLSRGLPREAVTPRKQRRLLAAAQHYCHHHTSGQGDPALSPPVRFDVVEVVMLRGRLAGVEVIPDAFRAQV